MARALKFTAPTEWTAEKFATALQDGIYDYKNLSTLNRKLESASLAFISERIKNTFQNLADNFSFQD